MLHHNYPRLVYLHFCCTATLMIAAPATGLTQNASIADTLRFSEFMDATGRHPLVAATRARVRAARGARISAGALPNPVVTYQEEGMPRERMTFAMLPLTPLWQRPSQVRRATEELSAATHDAEQAVRVLAAEAARAYLDVAVAQVGDRIARDTESSLDTVVEFNRARVAEGVTAESDLIRVQLERNRAAAERAIGEAELGRAQARLIAHAAHMNRSREFSATIAVQTPSSIAGPLLDAELPSLQDLLNGVAGRRADVLAGRARARATRAGVSVERSMLIRDLSVMAGTMAAAGERAPMIGASVPIPLFDQNRGGVTRASAEADAVEIEAAWLEQQARGEIEGRYRAAVALQRTLRPLSEELVPRAEESQRIALAAYREGAATILHVIDATRAARDARLTYERAMAEWLITLTELYLAAGLDPVLATGATR